MPNPSGVNNFNRFAPEPAYGQKIQQRQLEQAAPVPTNPAMNAPRRAQKRASQPSAPQGQPAPPQAPTGPPSQQFVAAQAWAQIASIPGASDLVKQYAARAQQSG